MPYAPTVTVFTDASPCPRAEVLFESFAQNTTTVTVYRISGSRQSRVRAAVNVRVAGSLSRIDYEIPAGEPSYYRAEMFNNAGGSLGFTDPTTVTAVFSDTWVHNPLDPAGAIPVVLESGTAKTIQRPISGEVMYPIGRRVGVVVAGGRSGFRGLPLNVITTTTEAADKFERMFGDYLTSSVPVLCIRPASTLKIRIPRPTYAAVLEPREREFDVRNGGTTIVWETSADEVSPPAEALIVPILTNADLRAYYATNAAMKADNLTNLAITRRYDLAGTAL